MKEKEELEEYKRKCLSQIELFEKLYNESKDSSDKDTSRVIKVALEALINSVEVAKNGACLSNLRTFRVTAYIPSNTKARHVIIRMRLDQVRTSVSLPKNHFIVIESPNGEKYQTPRTLEKDIVHCYTHDFDCGERSENNLSSLKSSFFKFKLYGIPPGINITRPVLVGEDVIPLGSLAFMPSISHTVRFKRPDGSDTYHAFDCKITMDKPLIPDLGKNIEEIIRVFSL